MTVGCSAKVAEVLVTWTTALEVLAHAASSTAPTVTTAARIVTGRLDEAMSGGAGIRPAPL